MDECIMDEMGRAEPVRTLREGSGRHRRGQAGFGVVTMPSVTNRKMESGEGQICMKVSDVAAAEEPGSVTPLLHEKKSMGPADPVRY